MTRVPIIRHSLWFDVETRYKTTINDNRVKVKGLWFDVETRYKTTFLSLGTWHCRCGLM